MRNRSLAQFLANSSLIPLIFAVGLLAVSNASAGEPVYKWKDSSGQSHYSQQPPDGVKYETINGVGGSTTTPAATPASGSASTKPATNPNGPTPAQNERQKVCEDAGKNVDVLTNRPLVSMDINNSGKATVLTPEQQSQQLDIAKKQQAAYCSK